VVSIVRIAIVVAASMLFACGKPPFPRTGVTLGGKHVAYTVLRAGRNAYGMYCIGCHGEAGDGRGPMGVALRPRPRDLRLGTIRYAWVLRDGLPRDEDLARAIRHGLRGTPMQGWELANEEVSALVQYVKLFAPRWRREVAAAEVIPSADPWSGRDDAARARGVVVYHSVSRCWSCHPAYEPRDAIELVGSMRGDLSAPIAVSGEDGTRMLPPDFLVDILKAGDATVDVYRDVACGIGGVAMPALRGVLPEADLWALAHYVHGLTARRRE
jgi:mono/diheme cytochrome c family protein